MLSDNLLAALVGASREARNTSFSEKPARGQNVNLKPASPENWCGMITPDVFRRGLDALRSLKRIADRHQPDALVAVATSAVREAQNGGEFARAVRDELGIDIRVIRGQEEAHLIYLGARSTLDFGGKRALIADVGGGSVELIVGDARESYYSTSLKLGVLRLTEERVSSDPISSDERAKLGQPQHHPV